MVKMSLKIEAKQKKLYAIIVGSIVVITITIILLTNQNDSPKPTIVAAQFDTPSSDTKPENIRLSHIEQMSDLMGERLQSLEKSLLDLKEEKTLIEIEKSELHQETQVLKNQIKSLETEIRTKTSPAIYTSPDITPVQDAAPALKVWEPTEKANDRNVLFEIPAGTVIKAVLVSGADCSVAVQKPTGPNMVLLRPLDNGKLPRNVRVPLKGSVIIGNAIGDIASERVYVRTERMTLVEKNGSFIETEISAYVSGEDGREGLRGVVVDRSGQIVTRAAFASFLSGISQTVQATLNNQTIEKLAEVNGKKTILDIDLYRNSAFQGGVTALDKLSEYYIKRAEQLQPAIQVAAGRIVDVIFVKTVKVGEKDLKKKLDREREMKLKELQNG